MSRHLRKTDSGNTRSRLVLGGAMTAVFLSGGAGVAMASDHGSDGQRGSGNTHSTTKGGDISNDVVGNVVGQVVGPVLSGNTGKLASNNSFLNGNLNDLDINILSHQDDHKKKWDGKKHDDEDKGKHKGGKHHWVDRDRDGCDDEDGHRWSDRDHDGRDDCEEDDKGTDCDEPESKDDEKKDEDTKDEAKDDEKDTKAEPAADTSDDAKPEVENVASTSTEPGATPVGAADTGDGSFIGGVAPVASSWSMGDTMLAAGGGLAAAGLLAGAGVGMGRHRRTAHRHSA